ncbi:MAG: beta-lactamase family protein [Thermomicrobiales bacterium]|nr:beta-lactamase family protein [Thermomicrobiales bacterium]MCO5222149.1 beta-lactamase family protein [Thermomicrobiales bacterium]
MLLERIDMLAGRALDGATAQGVALGIATPDGERLIRTAGYANRDAQLPVTEETLFEIGSISKSALAIVCMQLAAEGRLDLHAPVTEYLPWFLVQSEFAPITTHHLLAHTSGLPGGHTHRPHALHEVWELRNVRLIFPPGAVWDYSNVGYDAVGLLVEAITGQTFAQLMTERVLAPLGLTSSYASVTSAIRPRLAVGYTAQFDDRPMLPWHGVAPATWLETAVGSGSIVMNVSDLLAYAEFLKRTWTGEDSPVLTSAQLREMVRPPRIEQPAADETHGYGYGIGWELDPQQPGTIRALAHSGGMVGYTTDLIVDLDRDLCVVWLANGSIADRALTTAVRETAGLRNGEPFPELVAVTDRFAFTDGADYAGVWRSRERSIELVAEGTTLALVAGDERIPLQWPPGRGTAFLLADHPEWWRFPLEVVRDGDEPDTPGPVIKLHHGGETFHRQNTELPEPPAHPEEWDRFAGLYRSYNPWGGAIWIVIREGTLMLLYASGSATPLVPEGDGFRVGESAPNADFLTFEGIAGEQAVFLRFETGAEYSRFFPE